MSKIDFAKRLAQYQERRKTQPVKELRLIKLIGVTVSKIISNNNKTLSNDDIKDICIKVYGKHDKIKASRVYGMINQPAIKEEINDRLLDYYIKEGIEPIKESVECTKKAKEVAKTTSDYMQLAKHYQVIADRLPQTTVKQTEKVNYNELLEPIGKTVTREVSTTTVINSPKHEETPIDSQNNTNKASESHDNE